MSEEPFDLKKTQRRAQQGDAEAQFSLAIIATYEQDYHTAAKWLKKAVEKNHRPAQHQLAQMYLNGLGVEKNEKTGLSLLQEAYAAGEVGAAVTLGEYYMNQNDSAKAIEYLQAAVQGDSTDDQKQACMLLGQIYHMHESVRNYEESAKWLRRAVELNHPDAMFALGLMTFEGTGVPQDDQQALSYFANAAALGHEEAVLNTAILLCTRDNALSFEASKRAQLTGQTEQPATTTTTTTATATATTSAEGSDATATEPIPIGDALAAASQPVPRLVTDNTRRCLAILRAAASRGLQGCSDVIPSLQQELVGAIQQPVSPKLNTSETHRCSSLACQKRESAPKQFQVCAKCRRAAYCSRECQVLDWKMFGHQGMCALYVAADADAQ